MRSNKMVNTIWSEWYNQDRFLGKPYPFIDNYPKPTGVDEDSIMPSKLERRIKLKSDKKEDKHTVCRNDW